MTGIVAYGAYLPDYRLQRADVAAALGASAQGQRCVAGYDEDTTTMAVQAARPVVRGAKDAVRSLWFATTDPAYADKSNAATIHAALGLRSGLQAADLGAALRSGAVALTAAAGTGGLAVLSDRRGGPVGGTDERTGGDGAAAFLFGPDTSLAELTHTSTVTADFLDRWRDPASADGATWEERFGERRYLELANLVLDDLEQQGVRVAEVDAVAVAGPNARAVRSVTGRLSRLTGRPGAGRDAGGRDAGGRSADDPGVAALAGYAGAAHIGLVLCDLLDHARPGQTLLALSLADGADAFVLRTGPAVARPRGPAVRDQLQRGCPVGYPQYLVWRGRVAPERPRRPEPHRPSAPFAWRDQAYKLAFEGSRCRNCGAVQFPAGPLCFRCRSAGAGESVDASGQAGRIVTFTVDHLAYSPSPPLISAIVAFEGGGRLQCELTDVHQPVAVGDTVVPTFRRGATVDGIHNYAWKARPARSPDEPSESQPWPSTV